MKTRVQIGIVSTLVILVLLPTSVVSQTYPDGMVAYWKFEEGTGNIAHDSVSENHGDLFGATWTDGRVGSSLLFDGNDDYVEGAYESGVSYRIGTVEGWIKLYSYPTTYRYGVIATAALGQSRCNFTEIVEIEPSGRLAFYLWDAYIIRPVGNTVLNLNEWYHVAATVDMGDSGLYLKLYLNGNLEASVPCTYSYRNIKFVFSRFGSCWGYRWSHEPFHGALDEVAIHTRALTAAEIQQHYQNGLNGVGYEVPLYCVGFEPPMAGGPVTARGNRALPLKAQLFDDDGYEMTDMDLAAPPVIQVWFDSSQGGDSHDVTGDAYPAGWGTEGNEFEYNPADQVWQYNLKTKNYSAGGTYTINIVSGDKSEYTIDPTCEAVFEKAE